MWLVSIRDLQWRRRRFVIGVLATGVLFAITLILSGVSSNMRTEVVRTVEATGADRWLVGAGINGPLGSVSVMPMDAVAEAAALPGVQRADPLVMLRQSVAFEKNSDVQDIVIFGVSPGGLGMPAVVRGRGIEAAGEAVIDERSGAAVGDVVMLGAADFEVVGLTRDSTIAGGIPNMFADVEDVQAAIFQGAPLIQAVLVQGEPTSATELFTVLTPTQVVDDVMRPISLLTRSLELISLLLWVAAASVVGSIVYLTAVERTRDFATLRALGVGRATLLLGLATQGVLTSSLAALLSIGMAWLIIPLFPTPLWLTAPAVRLLFPVAIVVGIAASAASAKRVLSIDPAAAFASA